MSEKPEQCQRCPYKNKCQVITTTHAKLFVRSYLQCPYYEKFLNEELNGKQQSRKSQTQSNQGV